MTYGINKARDIANGSLASGRRKGARDDRAAAHRRHRSAVRQALRQHRDEFDIADDYYDGLDEFAPADNPAHRKISDADLKRNKEISNIMWDRRTDNLGAAYRFGERHLKGVANEDLATQVFKILPDTVAGRHCAGHILDYIKYERDWYDGRRFYNWRRPNDKWLNNCKAARYIEILTDVVETGRAREFNSRMGWDYTFYGSFDSEGVPMGTVRLTTSGSAERVFVANVGPGGYRRVADFSYSDPKIVRVLREMGYSVPA